MTTIGAERIANDLEQFLREACEVSPLDDRFDRKVDLWDGGYLDSLGAVDLIEFLETRYEVTIPREILFDPDFVHIEGMARLVEEVVLAGAGADDAPAPGRSAAGRGS